MNRPIKVLQIIPGNSSFGGIEKLVRDICKYTDCEKVQYDIVFMGSPTTDELCTELRSCCTGLYALNYGTGVGRYPKLFFALKDFLKKHRYDIIHVHPGGIFLMACDVLAIKLFSRSRIVVHSHFTGYEKQWSLVHRIVFRAMKSVCRLFIRRYSDLMISCSQDAGIYMFGKNSRFTLVKNGIETANYRFDPAVREKLRIEFFSDKGLTPQECEKTVIYGHVGRMTLQKNPLFIVDLFNELHRRNPDSYMWMIGEGDMQAEVRQRINDYGLSDHVWLAGLRTDIPELLSAMDVFLLPSFYEGMPIVAVEAQTSGLPFICSEKVTREAKITELSEFISLDRPVSYWADRIEKIDSSGRTGRLQEIRAAGYDIRQTAKKIQNCYIRLAKRKGRNL